MASAITKLPVKTDSKTVPGAVPARPRASIDNLRREIDRVFDIFNWGSWGFPQARRAFDFELPSLATAGWDIAPAVDVAEKDKEYEITAELPGLDEKNIEVKLSHDTLTIKGEKKEETQEKRKDYHLCERHYGSFTRSFQLPEGVDRAKIEASFSKGVLTVKLPKSVEAQKNEHKITIKAA